MVNEKDNIKLDLKKTYRKSEETFFNCDDSSLFQAAAAATAKKGKGGKPGK